MFFWRGSIRLARSHVTRCSVPFNPIRHCSQDCSGSATERVVSYVKMPWERKSRHLGRLRRIFGYHPEAPPVGPVLPGTKLTDALLVAIDVDSKITLKKQSATSAMEGDWIIGVSIVDTRHLNDLLRTSPGAMAPEDVVDSRQYHNGESSYTVERSRRFELKFVRPSQAILHSEFSSILHALLSDRNVFIVWHGGGAGDIRFLELLDFDAKKRSLGLIDTFHLAEHLGLPSRLVNLPARLGLRVAQTNRHTAGIDAHVTIKALLALAAEDCRAVQQDSNDPLALLLRSVASAPASVAGLDSAAMLNRLNPVFSATQQAARFFANYASHKSPRQAEEPLLAYPQDITTRMHHLQAEIRQTHIGLRQLNANLQQLQQEESAIIQFLKGKSQLEAAPLFLESAERFLRAQQDSVINEGDRQRITKLCERLRETLSGVAMPGLLGEGWLPPAPAPMPWNDLPTTYSKQGTRAMPEGLQSKIVEAAVEEGFCKQITVKRETVKKNPFQDANASYVSRPAERAQTGRRFRPRSQGQPSAPRYQQTHEPHVSHVSNNIAGVSTDRGQRRAAVQDPTRSTRRKLRARTREARTIRRVRWAVIIVVSFFTLMPIYALSWAS